MTRRTILALLATAAVVLGACGGSGGGMGGSDWALGITMTTAVGLITGTTGTTTAPGPVIVPVTSAVAPVTSGKRTVIVAPCSGSPAVVPVQVVVKAEGEGYVESIDALEIGLASVELGAGRMRKDDRVDPAAGMVIEAPVGARVRAGDALVVVHARSGDLVDRVTPRIRNAWRMSDRQVRRPPHVLARVDRNGVSRDD